MVDSQGDVKGCAAVAVFGPAHGKIFNMRGERLTIRAMGRSKHGTLAMDQYEYDSGGFEYVLHLDQASGKNVLLPADMSPAQAILQLSGLHGTNRAVLTRDALHRVRHAKDQYGTHLLLPPDVAGGNSRLTIEGVEIEV